MMKLFTCIVIVLACSILQAQTTEELAATLAAKQAEFDTLKPQSENLTAYVETLKTEIEDLEDLVAPYPRWDLGAIGNLGFNFSEFTNWLSKSSPNTTAFTIGVTTNAWANLDQRKYFWRNSTNVTLGWVKFDDRDDPLDEDDFEVAADAFTFTSLYGYKIGEKLAISALGEYRTSVLEDNLNDPGYLDLGAGITWIPIKDLYIMVHPLNYNFIFSTEYDYQQSMGAKLVIDYIKEITKDIGWKTNFSGFMSYEGSDLSNWTWTNGFTTAVKGFGFGLDFGLRGNKQEALAAERTDNPLQSYWIVGITYKI